MSRAPMKHYLARQERDRLRRVESQAKARLAAREVLEGVAETTALDEGRGAEFLRPTMRRGERQKPVRRMTGLEWLYSRSPPRITAEAKAVGERYGALWRAAEADPAIRSNADDSITGAGGDPVGAAFVVACGRVDAERRLNHLREVIASQSDLVAALDLICGKELTPREASINGAAAARLESLLIVALDLLVGRIKMAA